MIALKFYCVLSHVNPVCFKVIFVVDPSQILVVMTQCFHFFCNSGNLGALPEIFRKRNNLGKFQEFKKFMGKHSLSWNSREHIFPLNFVSVCIMFTIVSKAALYWAIHRNQPVSPALSLATLYVHMGYWKFQVMLVWFQGTFHSASGKVKVECGSTISKVFFAGGT